MTVRFRSGLRPLRFRWRAPSMMLALLSTIAARGESSLPPTGVRFDQNLGEQVPLDVVLQDETGRARPLKDYFGSTPVVLVPVYYKCPMLCGLELNGLVRCLRGMSQEAGRDFMIVTFSIDPLERPPLAAQKRKQYLAQYGRPGAESGWHFLTGEATAIESLCDAIGFHAVLDERTGQYAHAAGVVVCTPEGQISRYLLGVEFVPRDLRLAVAESASGTIGSLADHVLLYCFAYDPTRGKYGLAILNLLRLGGVLTVLALGGSVLWMLRREHPVGPLVPVEGRRNG